MIRKVLVASVLAMAAAPVFAADCSVTVTGTDQMTWDVKNIDVSKSCKEFTVNLKHSGSMPKQVMGHNWVLAKAGDFQPVSSEGMAQGLDKNYVNDADARVLAHSKVIGGGESDSITFDVSKLAAGEEYTYFCSFPGHFSIMRGTLKLVD
ncbi:azurin [Stutzerimonas kirkiae]|uniref:Azurin n=1 Tax=Stutzerimonas kirkiae TaxID=2211392 RepID=A0A4Q9RDU9_9GAMM|nr:azurin [Stutzerimonas kirkiae]TBU98682.1 azurin [Stutzerimonas kirkiae]TBV00222.1 azurin [Stutzerimonas kirkiae]